MPFIKWKCSDWRVAEWREMCVGTKKKRHTKLSGHVVRARAALHRIGWHFHFHLRKRKRRGTIGTERKPISFVSQQYHLYIYLQAVRCRQDVTTPPLRMIYWISLSERANKKRSRVANTHTMHRCRRCKIPGRRFRFLLMRQRRSGHHQIAH